MVSEQYLLVPCDRVDHLPSRFQEAATRGDAVESGGLAGTGDGSRPPRASCHTQSCPLPCLVVVMVNCFGAMLAMAFKRALGSPAASAGCWVDELMLV